ncbi:unnamed protein product [Prunus armeniaca]
MALPLMSAKVPKSSIEEYMMFFRHCTKRSAAQWHVVLRRTYPRFQTGYRLFDKELEDEEARTNFRKKFLSVMLLWALPFGGGTSWRDADDLDLHKDCRCAVLHKDCRCAVNKINNSADAIYPSWEPNSCSSAEFDAWWKARFIGLPDSSSATKTIKDINAQVIEDPSMTRNLGGQVVQVGEVFVTSIITIGDLELPFGDEENQHGTLAEQSTVEVTPFARRNKRKETAQARDSVV